MTCYRVTLCWFDYTDRERSQSSWDRCHISVCIHSAHDIVAALTAARGRASVMSQKLKHGRVWEVTGIHET